MLKSGELGAIDISLFREKRHAGNIYRNLTIRTYNLLLHLVGIGCLQDVFFTYFFHFGWKKSSNVCHPLKRRPSYPSLETAHQTLTLKELSGLW